MQQQAARPVGLVEGPMQESPSAQLVLAYIVEGRPMMLALTMTVMLTVKLSHAQSKISPAARLSKVSEKSYLDTIFSLPAESKEKS